MKRKRKTKVKVEMTDSENIEAGVRMVDLNVLAAFPARALHTTGRGSVTFGYESRPDEIYIYVRDTGEGFGPDHDPWRDDAALAECAAGVAGLGGAYGSESTGVEKGLCCG